MTREYGFERPWCRCPEIGHAIDCAEGAYQNGIAEERARIVAWLSSEYGPCDALHPDEREPGCLSCFVAEIIERLERREHIEGETAQEGTP